MLEKYDLQMWMYFRDAHKKSLSENKNNYCKIVIKNLKYINKIIPLYYMYKFVLKSVQIGIQVLVLVKITFSVRVPVLLHFNFCRIPAQQQKQRDEVKFH